MFDIKNKKRISIVLILTVILTLTGCSTYTSNLNVDDTDKYLKKITFCTRIIFCRIPRWGSDNWLFSICTNYKRFKRCNTNRT